MKLEVCVDSFSSLRIAQEAGANRIELCGALNIGGVTPSYGLMKQAAEVQGMEIFVMIRPRSGDFLYDDNEFETMLNDIEIVKKMNFDGIVTGVLKSDGKIDLAKMEKLAKAAQPLKTVLHRAFDDANEPINDIDKLIEIGITRILTSGQAANALLGADYIANLQRIYGDRIEIMPGCGVNAENIAAIYDKTGCTNYHLSGKINIGSQMIYKEYKERMKTPDSEFIVEKADFDLIKKAKDVITRLS